MTEDDGKKGEGSLKKLVEPRCRDTTRPTFRMEKRKRRGGGGGVSVPRIEEDRYRRLDTFEVVLSIKRGFFLFF